jgi:hypothetical protein
MSRWRQARRNREPNIPSTTRGWLNTCWIDSRRRPAGTYATKSAPRSRKIYLYPVAIYPLSCPTLYPHSFIPGIRPNRLMLPLCRRACITKRRPNVCRPISHLDTCRKFSLLITQREIGQKVDLTILNVKRSHGAFPPSRCSGRGSSARAWNVCLLVAQSKSERHPRLLGFTECISPGSLSNCSCRRRAAWSCSFDTSDKNSSIPIYSNHHRPAVRGRHRLALRQRQRIRPAHAHFL